MHATARHENHGKASWDSLNSLCNCTNHAMLPGTPDSTYKEKRLAMLMARGEDAASTMDTAISKSAGNTEAAINICRSRQCNQEWQEGILQPWFRVG